MLTEHHVPGMMVEMTKGVTDRPRAFMLVVNLLLLIVDCLSVFKCKLGERVLAAVPFTGLMLGCLAVIVWQPWISLNLHGR